LRALESEAQDAADRREARDEAQRAKAEAEKTAAAKAEAEKPDAPSTGEGGEGHGSRHCLRGVHEIHDEVVTR
jgi:sRNA-binding protein